MNYRYMKRVNFILVLRAAKSTAAFHEGYMVDKMALGQIALKTPRFPVTHSLDPL
jgi:hypothetical protein